MELTWTSCLLGWAAATLVGLSKTGVPGVSLPAILLMTMAFAGNEKASVAAILPILLLGDCFSVWYYRQHADWKRLLTLFPYTAAGMVPGVLVLLWVNNAQFKQVLGWTVLGLLALEFCRQKFRWEAMPGRWWFSALLGVSAGFGTMVGNAAGPIMSVYLVARGMRKEQFMGTWAWFFLIVNSSKAPIFLAMKCGGGPDLLTPVSMNFIFLVLPGVIVGALVGRRVFTLIPQRLFDPIVLGLAGLAALRMVVG